MDELGVKLAELAEEAAGGTRPAGPAAARRRGARRRRRQAIGALVLVAGLVAGLAWVDQRPAGRSIVALRVLARSCWCRPRTPAGRLTRCGTW
jgi:hypothetical protein